MMKIAVVGSRTFNDYGLLKRIVSRIKPTVIVSGGAQGADLLAERYARESGLELMVFKPNWKRFGRAAGPVRNKEIVAAADLVIAFWDGKSFGTRSTLKLARKMGKPVHVVRFVA